MKISIITTYWKNSHGGGIKNYLLNLIEEYNQKTMFETIIIFREGDDPYNYKIEANKFIFIAKSFLVLKRINPEIIHSQEAWYNLMAGYLYVLIFEGKLIHTFRSEPSQKLPYIATKIMQIMINKCSYVTFVSEGLKNAIESVYGLKFNNVVITYPGVKGKDFTKKDLCSFYQKYNIEGDSFVLLIQAFTANKLKKEGVKYIFHTLESLIDKHPNIILLLTREGAYSEELKEYAQELGISNNVIFTGDVENPFVPLEICDIFLFPWLGKSGISNALLEAMYMGKPIIATYTHPKHGVSEVIENNKTGFLVPAESKDIAEKIEYVIQNPNVAERVGENARTLALKDFTWEATADLFERLYKNDIDD
jgi:glycosyltransferase involved in cell wall biosynthesis